MDKYLFDTSSLISLVQYYLPFDADRWLQNFLYKGFEKKEFILLRAVKDECENVRQGLVFKEFIKDSIKTTLFDEVVTEKLHREIDNNFIASLAKKKQLEEQEYNSQKQEFIKSADFQLIYYAIQKAMHHYHRRNFDK